jgi:hypothetical protein
MITLALTTSLCGVAQDAEVSSRLEPVPGRSAATGEPLVWTVTVSGPDSGAAALDGAVEFGPEWAVLEGPTPVVDSTVPASARPGLELRWTLMGLEAGEVATPVARIRIGEEEPVELEPARIELSGALGDGEDSARPLVGFREVEEENVGDANLVLLGAAALVLAVLLPFIRRAGRRTAGAMPVPDRAPDLLERIAALDPAGEPAVAMGALGPLLRRAVDEVRGEDRGSLTDSEWAASLDGAPGVEPEQSAALASLMEELSLVRYGGAQPSSFAAREAIERATAQVRDLRVAEPRVEGEGRR